MLEKRFYAVPPQLFTANGTISGVITIAANACTLFKVKQKVWISANTLPKLLLEIKEIDSNENIQVGPIPGTLNVPGANTGISARTDISAYTVALGANIFADEQKRPAIDNIEIVRATYEEEPTVAVRSIMVDPCGNLVSADNPLPVAFDGDIQIGDVSIVEGGNTMDVNSDGSINVNVVNSIVSSAPGLTILTNEITSVPAGFETTIITVTAPSDGYRIQKIEVSGDTIALFKVYVNASPILYKRTWWGEFNETFNFENFSSGLLLTSGQVLTVTCYQTSPFLGTFEATVMTLIN
jgi:hypothetical protein